MVDERITSGVRILREVDDKLIDLDQELTDEETERNCGWRKSGGVYLVDKLKGLLREQALHRHGCLTEPVEHQRPRSHLPI